MGISLVERLDIACQCEHERVGRTGTRPDRSRLENEDSFGRHRIRDPSTLPWSTSWDRGGVWGRVLGRTLAALLRFQDPSTDRSSPSIRRCHEPRIGDLDIGARDRRVDGVAGVHIEGARIESLVATTRRA